MNSVLKNIENIPFTNRLIGVTSKIKNSFLLFLNFL